MSRPAVRCLIGLTLIGGWTGLIGRSVALSEIKAPGQVPAPQEKSVAPDKNIGKDKAPAAQSEKATTERLGGTDRYLTALSTDKPIYKIGDTVYMRGVMLNASDHKPLANATQVYGTVTIKGPKGDTVSTGVAQTKDSVWGYSWQIPPGQAGGEYTCQVTYPAQGYTPAQRKFDVRAYRAPRLNSQITFLRDGYGPGEKVQATLDVKRAEGGVPEGAKVTVSATVDGQSISGETGTVDAKGLCTVSLTLPTKIPRGEGTLALAISDGGVVETASKTIPILLQTVDLQILPEGGDLIAGFKNRVYIQAKQPNGKPADLTGKIFQHGGGRDKAVAQFHTEHEGRGRFEFTPLAHRSYTLTISAPAGIKTVYRLPEVKSEGAVLRADSSVYTKGKPITVQVGCTSKDCQVTVSKREKEFASCKVKSGGRKNELRPVSLSVPADADGVLTVTVWDKDGAPLAERLVFREPSKTVHVTITPDEKSYIPGGTAKVTIKSTDDDGKPVPAVVGLTVTDESVLEMVEKRDQAPRLPVMVYLEPEVKDLADAHVYMDSSNPKAPIATDLLLGTQGWRRFALMQLAKFVDANGDDAKRVVAMREVRQQNPAFNGVPMAAAMGHAHFKAMLPAALKKGPAVLEEAAQVENERRLECDDFRAVAVQKNKASDKDMEKAKPNNVPSMRFDFGANTFPMDARPASRAAKLQNAAQLADIVQAPAAPAAKQHPPGDFKVAALGMASVGHGLVPPPPAAAMQAQAPRQMFMARKRGHMLFVREFVHIVRPDRKPTDRVDFAETLYWNAGVSTDPTTGEASVSFGLSDAVTTFRVFADAFSNVGAIGTASLGVKSVQPFYAEAKLPLEVTSGDHLILPINLINSTSSALTNPNLSIDLKGDFKIQKMLEGHITLSANERARWLQPIDVGAGNGPKDFNLHVKAGEFEDNVTRSFVVKPKGFPIETTFGGIIEPSKPIIQTIDIPEGVVAMSLVTNTGVYPSPLANLTEALRRLIQDPNGCFEQTSSTSYPLTMAQQYFLTHTGVEPKLVEASREKLDAGYKKLVGFWCPDRGYEWFGQDPGHEALTAFGLLHFTDMSKVRDVDQNMISTTRAWLLKQKDGQGGFTRKRRALHTWIEDKDCSNAYILWALLESGQSPADLKPELESLKKTVAASQNNYVVALAANAFYLAGDKSEAKRLMDRLVAKQKDNGSMDGVTSSIVGSGGESLEIEGTALATLAWLRDSEYAPRVEKSMKFLADSCQGGRYGSTQSTVLALRAIVTYDKQRAHPKAAGTVQLFVDGQSIGDKIAFDEKTQGSLKLPDMSELLTAGHHKLELRMEHGSAMPYSMDVKYNVSTPLSSKDCKLDIATNLSQTKVAEGAATEADVLVSNKSKDVIPNPVAIVGIPGGLEPRHDQLKELVKKGTIDNYEVLGREVVLYWRTLSGGAKVNVPLSLIAAIPGTYTGPASRTYLYYTDEHKKWVDGLNVEITPKK
ncbi:MAG TPA: MG2 domain-containing protein [Oculatellaceae cyanobacterium]